MTWTVFVPLKAAGDRKSRLAGHMPDSARARLSCDMFDHVARCLAAMHGVHIVVVSLLPPHDGTLEWYPDAGLGLNMAIHQARAARRPGRFAVIHADLPLLNSEDVTALLAASGECGVAIAPDRHDAGTNALAIADDRPFTCQFGADSLRRHIAEAGTAYRLVRRIGFALDIDTPADIALCDQERKQFFFEKKNQKTFTAPGAG